MKSISRLLLISLALVLILSLGVGCSSTRMPATQPSPTPSVMASRTLKPTFTSILKSTQTLAPTLTPRREAPSSTTDASMANRGSPTAPPEVTQVRATLTQTQSPVAPTATRRSRAKGRMNSPEYGIQAFLWWRPEVASRDLQMIREAGFTWCKVNFAWRDIEGAAKGAFDWSRTDRIVEQAAHEGIDLVVRIDYQPAWAGGGFPTNGPPDNLQDLADFLTALVSRYKGRIRAYEVWNEPNLAREWGGRIPDPGALVRLLKVAYKVIKAADPEALVISPGLSPTGTWDDSSRPDDWYLESMYIAMGGKSDGYFDVLGAHGAGYKSPPERDPAEVAANKDLGGHRAFCFRRVEDLRAIMVKYGDADKQVALLEFGWTSDPRPDSPYHWHSVSEEIKADYLVRAYRYAKEHWSPWIGLMSAIYISDPDWTEQDEQYWWAITYPSYPQFKPRPAYLALKAMPK